MKLQIIATGVTLNGSLFKKEFKIVNTSIENVVEGACSLVEVPTAVFYERNDIKYKTVSVWIKHVESGSIIPILNPDTTSCNCTFDTEEDVKRLYQDMLEQIDIFWNRRKEYIEAKEN